MNFYASRRDAEIESLEILHSAFININLFYHHNNDRKPGSWHHAANQTADLIQISLTFPLMSFFLF